MHCAHLARGAAAGNTRLHVSLHLAPPTSRAVLARGSRTRASRARIAHIRASSFCGAFLDILDSEYQAIGGRDDGSWDVGDVKSITTYLMAHRDIWRRQ